MWNVDSICRISDLVASSMVVRFDHVHHCLSFRTVVLVLLYLSTHISMQLCINFLMIFSSYFLICIVFDHDVNIGAKQCFSCTNALYYFSTTSSTYQYSARESQ